MRDLASNISNVVALSPAVQAATVTGNTIDLKGYNSAALLIMTGAIAGAGDFTGKWQHSDTTTSGDFTDVAAADLVGTLPATLVADTVYKQSYIGVKQYLRPVLTKNGGTSIAAGAVVVRGSPRIAPAS